MSRDLVLCILAVSVCGLLTLAFAYLPVGRQPVTDRPTAVAAEARAWRRLWLPLLPAFWALAALVGWAAQEPATTDELLQPVAFALVVVPGLLLVRSALRAVWALRSVNASLPAATIGLIRPRVVVSEALRRQLDQPALAAAVAHERAHARHHDPLRLWLAQAATDLQWPSPAAARRLHDWRRALELARDEEARQEGIRGEDLAAAIIGATKLRPSGPHPAIATLTAVEIELSARVQRLLEPLPPPAPRGRRLLAVMILAGAIAAGSAGLYLGDLLVRALPLVAV